VPFESFKENHMRSLRSSLLGILMLMGCSRNEGAAQLTRLAIEDAPGRLASGTAAQLKVKGTYSDGTERNLTGEVRWSNSDDQRVQLTREGASAGRLRGLAPGAVQLVASLDGEQAQVQLEVGAAEVEQLRVSPLSRLARGQHAKLTATAIYSDGTQRDVTADSVWLATGSLSTADAPGEVAAEVAGEGTVAAQFKGVGGSSQTEVTGAQLVRLELEPAAVELPTGVMAKVSAFGIFSDGAKVDLSAQAHFKFADSNVLGVLSAGQVRAMAPGEGSLVAELGSMLAAAQVVVSNARPVRVELSPAAPVLVQGTQLQMKALGHFSDGSVHDLTAQAVWSSPAPTLADFVSVGSVNARTLGSATLEASFGGLSGQAELRVIDASLAEVSLAARNTPHGTN
jgi:hypothetical protein